MEIIDISMPVAADWQAHSPDLYPGTKIDYVIRRDAKDSDGRVSRSFSGPLHTGTHIDAADHMIDGGKYVEQYPLRAFVGRAALLDLRHRAPMREIDAEHIQKASGDRDLADQVVLVCTGWGDRYGEADYFPRSPYLTLAAAEALVSSRPRLVGTDFLATKHGVREDFPKRAMLGAGVPFLANLVNLGALLDEVSEGVTIVAFPFRLEGVEASMARAVALVGDAVAAALEA